LTPNRTLSILKFIAVDFLINFDYLFYYYYFKIMRKIKYIFKLYYLINYIIFIFLK
jgi:hypothetical protein